ncbi:unnamed protein product [Albugo candida]|uniref:Uncharacterized protein n=1 Tax=Albugo candida TaxID=65357 RepID=A0A024G100_9STRA|nr:unnamed protein product [Albugo candida]|eukprot:CCI39985.1 unnamed protein product [Albugo candida]
MYSSFLARMLSKNLVSQNGYSPCCISDDRRLCHLSQLQRLRAGQFSLEICHPVAAIFVPGFGICECCHIFAAERLSSDWEPAKMISYSCINYHRFSKSS